MRKFALFALALAACSGDDSASVGAPTGNHPEPTVIAGGGIGGGESTARARPRGHRARRWPRWFQLPVITGLMTSNRVPALAHFSGSKYRPSRKTRRCPRRNVWCHAERGPARRCRQVSGPMGVSLTRTHVTWTHSPSRRRIALPGSYDRSANGRVHYRPPARASCAPAA